MGCLLDIFDKLAEYEEEDLMAYVAEQYGPLTQISCVYPSYKRSMLPITLLTFAFHTFTLGSHSIFLMVTLYQSLFHGGDMKLISMACHMAVICFVPLFGMYFVISQRHVYAKQSTISSKDIGNYIGGRIYDEEWCVKESEKIQKEKMYYLLIPLAIGFGSGVILILPYTTKWINGMDEPYIVGMINDNLPIPCWYPFPTHEGILHWMTLILQFLAAGSICCITVTLLLYFLQNSQRIKYEFRVIGYSLESIFKRSMKVYLQMNPGKNKAGVSVYEPEFQKIIGRCLADSVCHHHDILECVSLYSEQLDVLAFITFMVGTGVIAVSLFNIMDAVVTQDYTGIIMFSTFIICETLVMFILCVLGESITSESVALRDKLYCSKWHYFDRRNRMVFLNFHTGMTEPIVVSAMGLVNMSLETFSSIMNSAYSFFNLINST